MSRHFRFVLAALAFLLATPIQSGVLFSWHPLSVLVRRLNLQDPSSVCVSSTPPWVTGPVLLLTLGVPFAGLLLSAAVVLATARRRRTPAVSPALGLAAALLAVVGAGALGVTVLPNALLEGDGVSVDPLQPAWVLLHFVPLWVLRQGASRWLSRAAGLAAVFGLLLGLGAVHQARARAQYAQAQLPPDDGQYRTGDGRLMMRDFGPANSY